jgi:RimJ/RimL family protein N-acetyltransferase
MVVAAPSPVHCGPITLVVERPDSAAAVADAINESLEHLRPWMVWAQRETTAQEQAMRLAVSVEQAQAGGDWSFIITEASTGRVVGGCGLHRRGDDDIIDVGYWVHVDHTGRGFVTHAAAALTRLGFEVLARRVVRITCDEANVASAAVPRRLGFTHVTSRTEHRAAPSDTGRTMVWELRREDWPESHAASFAVSYASP